MLPGEAELAKPDAILETGIRDKIQEFTRAGGTSQDVARLLSENYVGYAEMVNLVAGWIDAVELEQSENVIEAAVEDVVRHKFIASRADHALFKLERPPPLIDHLIVSERWWPVIKGLHQVHKGCGLLEEMHRKWSLREIAGDVDVTKSLDAFTGVLTDIMRNCLEADDIDSQSLAEMQRKVTALALYDERSFVITLRILASAEAMCEHKETAKVINQLAQEIRKEAVGEMTKLTRVSNVIARQWVAKFAVLFECVTKSLPIMKEPLETVLSFVFSESKTKSFQKEIAALNKTFEFIWDRNDPEALQERQSLLTILRQSEILAAMHRTLFSTQRDSRYKDARRKCLCMLLGCASVSPKGSANEFSRIEDKLLEVTAIIAKLKLGASAYEIKPFLATFKEALSIPVVAAGMVDWAHNSILHQPRPNVLNATLKYYVSIVDYAARYHPALRQQCLKALFDAFERDFTTERPQDALTDAELLYIRGMVAKALSNLTRMGCASDIVRFYRRNTMTIDKSMIRHFVLDLLAIAEPPFSRDFGESMLSYLAEEKVREITRRDNEAKKLVTSFVKKCTAQQNIAVPHTLMDTFPKEVILIQ